MVELELSEKYWNNAPAINIIFGYHPALAGYSCIGVMLNNLILQSFNAALGFFHRFVANGFDFLERINKAVVSVKIVFPLDNVEGFGRIWRICFHLVIGFDFDCKYITLFPILQIILQLFSRKVQLFTKSASYARRRPKKNFVSSCDYSHPHSHAGNCSAMFPLSVTTPLGCKRYQRPALASRELSKPASSLCAVATYQSVAE